MWRPKDWDGYEEFGTSGQWEKDARLIDIFEAGADAMLEALSGEHIEEGKHYCSPCGACSSDEDCRANESGRLVFIPEMEG